MPYWILERKLEKKGKDEILMSEIGYKMFISEQTQKFVLLFLLIIQNQYKFFILII